MYIKVKKAIVKALDILRIKKYVLNVPTSYQTIADVLKNSKLGATRYISVSPRNSLTEEPPIIMGYPISKRFTRLYTRDVKELFVIAIEGAAVFGPNSNYLICDNKLIKEVSREFGAEGGKKIDDFNFFKQEVYLPKPVHIRGNVAIINTCGDSNFHHWNYDMLPRFQMLKDANVFDEIDHYILNYSGSAFQTEGLKRLGIDISKIVNAASLVNFHIKADVLYVPSLTQDLGTINPYVINFLRSTFYDPKQELVLNATKLYISRGNAPSRKFVNESEVMEQIFSRGYVEFLPEKYSMVEAARIIGNAKSIVSIHGSGLSNLAFLNEGAKVLDIMSPYHQDPYYWLICNQRNCDYYALFAEGEHPDDDFDLVIKKVDNDLLIDTKKLSMALDALD